MTDRSPQERFAAFCKPQPNGCILWTGSTDSNGYGQFCVSKDERKTAHRYAYSLAYGEIEPGLCIHHACWNPRCVNPEHLQALTPSQHSKLHHRLQLHKRREEQILNAFRDAIAETHPTNPPETEQQGLISTPADSTCSVSRARPQP